MADYNPKADLRRYLQDGRDALLWKLDGLSEYDIRRPLVPTGTNLLGLVKHVTWVELGYFGDTFGLHLADGSHAHSACIGFGLDRITLALFAVHGADPASWPADVKAHLALT